MKSIRTKFDLEARNVKSIMYLIWQVGVRDRIHTKGVPMRSLNVQRLKVTKEHNVCNNRYNKKDLTHEDDSKDSPIIFF